MTATWIVLAVTTALIVVSMIVAVIMVKVMRNTVERQRDAQILRAASLRLNQLHRETIRQMHDAASDVIDV